MGVFSISISWWSFTGVLVTTSLLKSPKTLLNILAHLNNAVVWMISTCPFISKSSCPLYQSFCDCTKSTNDNWYNLHLHVPQFFQFLSKVLVLILLFTFFQFYPVVSWNSKVHNSASSLFLLIIIKSGHLAKIR